MTEAEAIILEFLKVNPESAFGRREISRKAVHRTVYEENPHWADAPLHALLQKKLIEINENGHYRFKSSA